MTSSVVHRHQHASACDQGPNGLVSQLGNSTQIRQHPSRIHQCATVPAYYVSSRLARPRVVPDLHVCFDHVSAALRLPAIMAAMAGEDDPFRDPAAAPLQPEHPVDGSWAHTNVPDTLAVGRNASLTLGTDSLVVLGT